MTIHNRSVIDIYREIQIVFPDYRYPTIEGKSIDEYVYKTATLCLLGPAQVQTKKGMMNYIHYRWQIV